MCMAFMHIIATLGMDQGPQIQKKRSSESSPRRICLAGRLDLTMGGPDLPITDADAGTRRSLWYRYSRDHQIKFLTVFDPASVEECYRRRHSIVPQQALAMSNSGMVLTRGRQLAERITDEVGSVKVAAAEEAFIDSAFERVLGRGPTPSERTACITALQEFAATSAGRSRSVRGSM